MLYKTRGIVLSYIRYRETSIITKIYTEEFGLQSYIVNGVRSKSSKGKIALFQPLTLLDLVVYHKHGTQINRLSEIRCSFPYITIPGDIKKSSIVLFLDEILHKTLKEEVSNPTLFHFLNNSLLLLDNQSDSANFPISFLLHFSRHIGFGIFSASDIKADVRIPLSDRESEIVNRLSNEEVDSTISNRERRKILDSLIDFYKYHVDNFGEVKSIEVLKEVLQA